VYKKNIKANDTIIVIVAYTFILSLDFVNASIIIHDRYIQYNKKFKYIIINQNKWKHTVDRFL
jgi:hypothetical protein